MIICRLLIFNRLPGLLCGCDSFDDCFLCMVYLEVENLVGGVLISWTLNWTYSRSFWGIPQSWQAIYFL